MTPTLLDTDTLTLFHKRHPQVIGKAALHVKTYGQLILSELSYYEVTPLLPRRRGVVGRHLGGPATTRTADW